MLRWKASHGSSLVGDSVLFGWALDVITLKSVLPGLATTKPNAALTFVLAGISH